MPIATIIIALGALATLLALIIGLIYGVGRFVASVDENTRATKNLSDAFEKHSAKTDATLVDHEVRISVLEESKRHRASNSTGRP